MIGLTALFKNEAPYLKEWLDFHLTVGVGHFYLYNNNSVDDYQTVLAPYKNVITLVQFPLTDMIQRECYNNSLINNTNCEWMGFWDIDEFVYPVAENSIPAILDKLKFPDMAGLAIHNVDMVEDFETAQTGGVVRNYIHRNVAPHNNSKMLIRVGWYRQYIENAHYIPANRGFTYDETGRKVWGANDFPTECIQHIRVNHYWAKSVEEFRGKLARGECAKDWEGYQNYISNIWAHHYNYHHQPRVEDKSALRFLPQL